MFVVVLYLEVKGGTKPYDLNYNCVQWLLRDHNRMKQAKKIGTHNFHSMLLNDKIR